MEFLPAKPIFIAKFYFDANLPADEIFKHTAHIKETLIAQLGDYHVIIVPTRKNEVTENCDTIFECFYPHDFPIKEFEEFKQNIEEQSKEFFKQSEN